MFSRWGKSKSSKEAKKKSNVESIITSLHRKITRPGAPWRHHGFSTSKTKSKSRKYSRSPSPLKQVALCHSFDEGPLVQSLPHPSSGLTKSFNVDSGKSVLLSKPSADRGPKISRERGPPLPRNGHVKFKASAVVDEGEMDSDDPYESLPVPVSPQTSDYENGIGYEANCPSVLTQKSVREMLQPANYRASPRSPGNSNSAHLQPQQGILLNAPDSLMLSPSRSPKRVFGHDPVTHSGLFLGSGPCLNPASSHNSGNNSFTEDTPCELFCPQGRCNPECSPLTRPRMMSPGPGSRIQSGRVTSLYSRAGPPAADSATSWIDDGRKQSYPLPLPPPPIQISTGTSPNWIPRSPSRTENPPSPTSCWKKGRLLGRGTFGHVYLGFNSESGEMCAMKEVTLFSDDAKSRESALQLRQEISLLSSLRHPNIVQYYGSDMIDNKLNIYLEYVSGGSIHRILQEYGHLGEAAIRSYTQQILSGLAYLHATNTLHRDIKGANILVDPNGRVRLADFGMAKHITGKSCPLSFKGSPYWMAPEVITNSSGCNLSVDIWSLGCTVLEMATSKPPWSQYEGVAAMFKVGNSKELPEIPDHLSDEGKDFVMKCLQRNPSHRPTAVKLLEHPFVKNASVMERPTLSAEPLESTPASNALGFGRSGTCKYLDSSRAISHSNSLKTVPGLSDPYLVRNISCPVSYGNSPQHIHGRSSPSPISSPLAAFGPLSSPGRAINGNYLHKPNAFRGVLQKTRSSVYTFWREDNYLGNNDKRPLSSKEQLYDAQFILASRVSEQLLGSPMR